MVDHDPVDMGIGHDCQVGPAQDGPQECRSSRPAFPVLDGEIEPAKAFLFGAVEVVIDGISCLLTGLDKCSEQRVVTPRPTDCQLSIPTMELVPALLVHFRAREGFEHIVIGPSGKAQLCPAIKIVPVAPHIEHPVDG